MTTTFEEPREEDFNKENLIKGLTLLLRNSRKQLSIKDIAQIIGGTMDDLELELLLDEIDIVKLWTIH